MKRMTTLLLLLLCAVIPAFAQDADYVPVPIDEMVTGYPARVLSVIDTVEVTELDGQPALHIVGSMPDGCERPTLVSQERQGGVVFVDVYHDQLPRTLVACPAIFLIIDITVPVPELLTLDEGDTLPVFIAVNDQYFYVNVAQIEPVGTPSAVPEILLTPLTRTDTLDETDLTVETVTSEEGSDGFVYLTVAGHVVNGCNDPALARVLASADSPTLYTVDVFRAIREPETCPLREAPEPFEFSVKTPVEVGVGAQFLVNGVSFDYLQQGASVPQQPPATGGNVVKELHGIESVEALILESYPAQIVLNVKGYQPNGCDFPVQVTQVRSDTTVKVEIFRELPADAICTMIIKSYESSIKLEGAFESGTYTIDVNGTVITVKI